MKDKEFNLILKIALCLVVVSVLGIFTQKYSKRTFVLDENDNIIARVKSEEEIKNSFERVKSHIDGGKIVKLEDIKTSTGFDLFRKATSSYELDEVLDENLPKYVNAWGVYKNDTLIAGLKSRDDVLDMLSQLKSYFIERIKTLETKGEIKILDIKFIDKVEVKHDFINENELLSKAEFYKRILNDTKESKVVFNEEFDTDICKVDSDGLENIYVKNRQPYSLDMIIKDSRTERIKLPQSSIISYDETLDRGAEIMDRKGVDGEVLRESENFFVNGQVVKTNILNEKVTVEPSSELLRVGDRDALLKPKFEWPSIGTVTSGFGARFDGFHRGIDIANYIGATVRASMRGTVVFAGRSGTYGNVVFIDHNNGYQTRYAHLLKPLVKKGQFVEAKEAIGLMGATGNATGPHVHFEILKDGKLIDPEGEL